MPDPNANLLAGGIIKCGALASLIGIGGIGKTRLALHLALHMLAGRDKWLGLDLKKPAGTVLFLSTENGCERWKTDLEKLREGFTQTEWADIENNLLMLALTPEEDGNLSLADETAIARLSRTVAETQPSLVILDPWADIIAGDENKNADVAATIQTWRQIVRLNSHDTATLIIHHARTGANNAAQAGDNFNAGNYGRGGKGLYSAVRAEIVLVAADKDDSTRLVLICGKANDAKKFETRGIIFNPDTFDYSIDSDFDVEDWRADVDGKRQPGTTLTIRDVVEAVTALCPNVGDETTTQKIHEKLKETDIVDIRTVRRWIGKAKKEQYLISPKKGFWRLGAKPL